MAIEDRDLPRVLVISGNAFSDTKNNGKTLSSFFDGYDKERLAQLYVYAENPDQTVCEKFYRITDYEILACFLRGADHAGGIHVAAARSETQDNKMGSLVEMLYKDHISAKGYNGLNALIHSLFKRRLPIALLARDILWNLDYWKTTELSSWLNEFSPQLVFFQGGGGVFSFRLATWISQTRKIPMIMQVTDDYVSPRPSLDIFFWIHYFRLKSWFAATVQKAYRVIAIGDRMAEEYKRRFGGQYCVLMNSVQPEDSVQYNMEKDTITFVYAGGLHLKRWETLAKIGHCLSELQNDSCKPRLYIYSNEEPDRKVKAAITIPNVMTFEGSLKPVELKKILQSADVLVHVEAFDRRSRYLTRLSISTKIPEYMVTGRCIFAMGPADIASIRYLQDNNMAEVCCSLDHLQLKDKLQYLIHSKEKREELGKRAKAIGFVNHNARQTQQVIKSLVMEAVNTEI